MFEITKKIIQFKLFVFRKLTAFIPYHEVSVLCYHAVDKEDKWELNVSPKTFEKQIKFLKRKHYYFCSTDDLVKHIKGEIKLPRKTVHITFDDGYRGVYENAFPILQRENIPFAIFLMGDFDFSKKARGTNRHGLFENEIAELKQSGLVTIGYHSRHHKMVDTLSGDEMIHEIKSDFDCKYFAYPGGHHNLEAHKILKEVGYEGAFSISPGLVNKGDNLYAIKRNVILKKTTIFDLYVRVTHVIEWYTKIVKFLKKKR